MIRSVNGRKRRIRNGWRLASKSFSVIQSDRTLLLLPMFSALSTLVAAALIFAPAGYYSIHDHSRAPLVIGAVAASYPFTFISTFFGVAFVHVAQKSLVGEHADLKDGIAWARTRLGSIAAWALLATIVGLLLRALERVRGGAVIERIVAAVVGAAWSLATLFVVPILAVEGPGPIETLRRSAGLIRKRWGEGITGSFVIGSAFGLLMIPIAIVGVIGWTSFATSHVFGAVTLAVAAALFLVVMAAQTAVSQMFHVVLYDYASEGVVQIGRAHV